MMTEGQSDTSSNKDNSNSNRRTVSSSSAYNNKLENVLILQGGGSLGAFGCGVFKALANNNIKLDIVAGTSIGGINAAIIAGSKVLTRTNVRAVLVRIISKFCGFR